MLLSAILITAGVVNAKDIADGLSAEEFRAYGKTSPTSIQTRIGQLDFTEGGFSGGFPTGETVEKLFDEMDFQRATQAYIWSVPGAEVFLVILNGS